MTETGSSNLRSVDRHGRAPALLWRAARVAARRRWIAARSKMALVVIDAPRASTSVTQYVPGRRPVSGTIIRREGLRARRSKKFPTLFVLLCTAAAAIYAYAIAAPMYLSAAQFTVRSPHESGTDGVLGKLGQGGGPLTALTDGYAVRDYLASADALADFDKRIDYLRRMSSPKGDIFNSLPANATIENRVAFYNSNVKVRFNATEGTIALEVYAFSPADAYDFGVALTEIASEFSVGINKKATDDTIRVAHEDLRRAEQRMANAQQSLAEWRKANESLDVEANVKMIQQNVGQLEAQLIEARNDLIQLRKNKLFETPRRRAVEERIATLQEQIARENGRLVNATTSNSLANQLGDYQRLRVEQEFASKAYELAAQSVLNAQTVASMQSKFVVKISGPTRSQTPVWPTPWKIILAALLGSMILSALGSLLVGVVRDQTRE